MPIIGPYIVGGDKEAQSMMREFLIYNRNRSDKEKCDACIVQYLILAVMLLVIVFLFSVFQFWAYVFGIANPILPAYFPLDAVPSRLPYSSKSSQAAECQQRVVGYYTEFESIDITCSQLNHVTHAVFANVEMNSDGNLRFKTRKAKERFMSLRRKSRQVESKPELMISIGGEENSQYFASFTNESYKRRIFVNSIYLFIKYYGIDGVDFYWKRAKESDKINYLLLLKEVREKLETMGTFTISVTIPAAGIENWEASYDLNQMLEYVDFINVFSMDYYGPWENQYGTPAGPTAPLYYGVGARKNFNVDSTMNYYVCNTQKPEKFNIVIPFFARLWKNVGDVVEVGKEAYRNVELKNDKAEGKPYMSRWTVQHDQWDLSNSTWDEPSKTSYIYDKEKEVYMSFETQQSIKAKMDYVKEKNLGGVWIWSLEMDDNENSLLNVVSSNKHCFSKRNESIAYKC
uniref:Glyco_18 domain-containing protein n=1 Tax=Caenorhabditis tropicalis TaxID=1561998 RepID=A0A1I7UCF7_9PELO